MSRVRLRKPRRIGRLSGFPGLDDTSGLLRYTPSADYFGTDTFAYTVVDPFEASASGAVIVEVTPVPDPPVVSLMADPLAGSTPLLVHFAAAASDPDQDTPTYSWDFGDGETAPNGARITLTFAF